MGTWSCFVREVATPPGMFGWNVIHWDALAILSYMERSIPLLKQTPLSCPQLPEPPPVEVDEVDVPPDPAGGEDVWVAPLLVVDVPWPLDCPP